MYISLKVLLYCSKYATSSAGRRCQKQAKSLALRMPTVRKCQMTWCGVINQKEMVGQHAWEGRHKQEAVSYHVFPSVCNPSDLCYSFIHNWVIEHVLCYDTFTLLVFLKPLIHFRKCRHFAHFELRSFNPHKNSRKKYYNIHT